MLVLIVQVIVEGPLPLDQLTALALGLLLALVVVGFAASIRAICCARTGTTTARECVDIEGASYRPLNG